MNKNLALKLHQSLHSNAATSLPSPLPAPVKIRMPRERLWSVSKEATPLPLGLSGRHILTGEELSRVELKSLLDFAIDLKNNVKKGARVLGFWADNWL